MAKKKEEIIEEKIEQPELEEEILIEEEVVLEDSKPVKIAVKKDIDYTIADSVFVDKLLGDLYFRVPDSYENIHVTADLNYVRQNRVSYFALLALRVVKPGGRVKFSKEFKPFLSNYVEEGDFIILIKEG